MNQHAEYFKQAELAMAAYGNFETNIPKQSELIAAAFSPNQANFVIIQRNSNQR